MLKSVDYQSGDMMAAITVRRATFLDDMVRQDLLAQALAAPVGETPRANAERTARIVVFPAICAATVEAYIASLGEALPWPLSFDAMMDLSPDLINEWMAAIWELNPSWAPVSPQAESAEKKDE